MSNQRHQFWVGYEWDPDTEVVIAFVPELPGCQSTGKTVAEARTNIKMAIDLYLECIAETGESLPEMLVEPMDVEFSPEARIQFPQRVRLAS